MLNRILQYRITYNGSKQATPVIYPGLCPSSIGDPFSRRVFCVKMQYFNAYSHRAFHKEMDTFGSVSCLCLSRPTSNSPTDGLGSDRHSAQAESNS